MCRFVQWAAIVVLIGTLNATAQAPAGKIRFVASDFNSAGIFQEDKKEKVREGLTIDAIRSRDPRDAEHRLTKVQKKTGEVPQAGVFYNATANSAINGDAKKGSIFGILMPADPKGDLKLSNIKLVGTFIAPDPDTKKNVTYYYFEANAETLKTK